MANPNTNTNSTPGTNDTASKNKFGAVNNQAGNFEREDQYKSNKSSSADSRTDAKTVDSFGSANAQRDQKIAK